MSGESEETEKCRYKSSESTCGKWEKRKDACINQASVPAESGRSGKAHVQTKRLYLRKAGEVEKRRYKSSESTCGKWEKRKDACINQASVPAESGRSGKAHVQTKRLYLRKVGEAEKRMYKPSVCTCGKCERWKAHVQPGHLYLRKYGCRKVWAQFRQPYALRGRKNPSGT